MFYANGKIEEPLVFHGVSKQRIVKKTLEYLVGY